MITSIRDLQVREGFIVTIAGRVIGIREDEFLLQDRTGQIWVDGIRRGSGTLDLRIGEEVTVTGDLDDLDDFDATRIVRAGGSEVIVRPFPDNEDDNEDGRPGLNRPGNGRPGNDRPDGDRPFIPDTAPDVNIGDLVIRDDVFVTISGTVTRIQENEFVLQDQTGQVLVDGMRQSAAGVNIAVGDRLRVVGDLDDADFDALRITRLDQPRQSIVGDRLNNQLTGSRGDDYLEGRGGDDILHGRAGNDILVGGRGRDRLTGGAGSDRFAYQSIRCAGDVITDFNSTQDLIDLQPIFNQPQYRSANPFSDYVQLRQTARGTVIRIDPDGDFGNASFQAIATLSGVNTNMLNANHFIV